MHRSRSLAYLVRGNSNTLNFVQWQALFLGDFCSMKRPVVSILPDPAERHLLASACALWRVGETGFA
jgi:hypothetical protein